MNYLISAWAYDNDNSAKRKKLWHEIIQDEKSLVNDYNEQFKDKYDDFKKFEPAVNFWSVVYKDLYALNQGRTFKRVLVEPAFQRFQDYVRIKTKKDYVYSDWFGKSFNKGLNVESPTHYKVTTILKNMTNHERRVFQASKEGLTDDQLNLIMHEVVMRKLDGYKPVFWYNLLERYDLALMNNKEYQKSWKEDNTSIWDYILPDGLTLPGTKYVGPGNKLVKGEPTSGVDAIAMKHDRLYALAETPEDIVKADQEMLDELKALDTEGYDTVTKYIASSGITLKKHLEKLFGHKYPKFPEKKPIEDTSINTDDNVSF